MILPDIGETVTAFRGDAIGLYSRRAVALHIAIGAVVRQLCTTLADELHTIDRKAFVSCFGPQVCLVSVL